MEDMLDMNIKRGKKLDMGWKMERQFGQRESQSEEREEVWTEKESLDKSSLNRETIRTDRESLDK